MQRRSMDMATRTFLAESAGHFSFHASQQATTFAVNLLLQTMFVMALGAAEPEPAKTPAKAVADEILVSGTVLKPDGSAAVGAVVRTGVPVSVTLDRRMGRPFRAKIQETITDANGRFSISIRENLYRDTEGFEEHWKNQKNSTVVAASLPGFGPAWLQFEEIEANQPVTLRLVDDVTIRGQVVDLEGAPVRGTTVTLAGGFGIKGDDLTEFFSMVNSVPIIFKQPAVVLRRRGLRAIDASLIGLPEKLTTDQDGRIEIKGLGKERLLHLAFTGGDVAYRVVTVASREMESIQPQNTPRSIIEPILGSKFQLAIEPSRPVEGIVVDADTGQPLPDVNIEIESNSDHHLMKTVSDQNGRFRAMGLPKAARDRLKFSTTDDRPYFPLSVAAPDPPGIEPVELNVKLHRGIWIKGKVTDKVTHAAVVGVNLHYYPLLSNEYAARVPMFSPGGLMDNDGKRYQSDSSGSYRIIGVPGPAVVGAENEFMRYRPGVGFDQFQTADAKSQRLPTWRNLTGPHPERTFAVRRIEPGADDKDVQLDLELDPGFSTTIRVVDQQGNLVKGVQIVGTGLRYALNSTGHFEDGIAIVDNLGPDETRILHASHADRNLGLLIRMQPPYDGRSPKEFVLEPLATVTGRLFEAGEPINRLAISPTYRSEYATVQMGIFASTDSEGRFRIGLIPGHEYELYTQGSNVRAMGNRTIIPGKLNVRAGETIDIGDFELDKDGFRPVKPKAADTKNPAVQEGEKREPPASKTLDQPPGPAPKPNNDQAKAIDGEKPEGAPTVDAKSSDEIIVTGLVLKPDGTPAAGATIRSAAPVSNQLIARLGRQVHPKMYEAVADDQGQFKITVDKAPYGDLSNFEPLWQDAWKGTPIVASLKGFGPMWREFSELEAGRPVTLRLVDDAPVRGQVVDLEANPVRGTSIRINRVQATGDEDLNALIYLLQQVGAGIFSQPLQFQKQSNLYDVEPRLINLPDKVTTDNEGWFEIRGLGKERVVHVAFDGGDIAYRKQTVLNRVMEPIRPEDLQRRRPIDTETIFGSKFRIAIPPARPIDGVVVDAATGKPIVGAIIGIDDRPDNRTVIQVMQVVSDQTGRFRFMGIAKAAGNRLTVLPPLEQPYFPNQVNVPDPDGIEPVAMKIELHRGLWIKGRVTDKATHQPVSGVVVRYYPYLKNEFGAGVRFRGRPMMENDGDGSTTDADGAYRMVGLPGRGAVGARSPFKPYRLGAGFDELKNTDDSAAGELPKFQPFRDPDSDSTHVVRAINPSVEEQEVRLDLELDPGVSTRIRLVDQQGKLATGTRVFGPGVQQEMRDTGNADESVITIENLGPNDKKVLQAYHAERELGLKFVVEPTDKPGVVKEFVIEPLAVVTGRLLEAGDPLRGLNVTRSYAREGGGRVTLFLQPSISTNAEGRFRITLIPGHEYSIDAQGVGQRARPMSPVATKLNVRAGETIDLGEFELDNGSFRPVKPNAADAKDQTSQKDEKREGPASKNPDQSPATPAPNPNSDQTKVIDGQKPSGAAAVDAKSADEIIVSGVVLKPDGTPAAGAIVRSAAPVSSELFARLGRQVSPKMVQTVADENGRFKISVDKAPYGDLSKFEQTWQDYWKGTPIVASLNGVGPTWREYSELEPGKPVTLRLVEDAPVRGQVVDLEGNPVKGTSVRIDRVQAADNEDLTTLIQRLRQSGVSVFRQPPSLQKQAGLYDVAPQLINLPDQVATDNEGRFEIRGVGKERVIHLVFDGGDIAYHRQTVLNREMEPLRPGQPQVRLPFRNEPIYGSNFTIAIPSARPIEGLVVDAVTGKPVVGASIGIEDRSDIRNVIQVMQTVSDQAGRFRAMGIPKSTGNQLVVFPPTDEPYFPSRVSVPNSDGLEPIAMKIELHRGLWIKGRITDKVTHQPVSGVVVHYYPYLKNEFAAGVSAFKLSPRMDSDNDRYVTDTNGFYRLIGLPGPGVVGARSAFTLHRFGAGFDEIKNPDDSSSDQLPTFKYIRDPHPESIHVVGAINPSVDQQEVRLDLELDPGVSIRIRLVDQQGHLATGTRVFGPLLLVPNIQRQARSSMRNSIDAIVTIENLGPKETRVFQAFHLERELGLKLVVEPPYESGGVKEFVVQPLAIVTGRLLDAGKPLGRFSLTQSYGFESGPRIRMLIGPPSTTNAEGRFRMALIPGFEYSIDARELAQGGALNLAVASKLTVRAGETIDLGDLELDNGQFRPVKPAATDKNDPCP